VALKQFLDFSGIVFALKINSEIKKETYPFPLWAEPVSPTHLPGPAVSPQKPIRTKSLARRVHGGHGLRTAAAVSLACTPGQPRAPCPIKAARSSLPCASPLSSASPAALHRFAPPSIVPSRAPPPTPHLDSPLGGTAGAN
jgi:hypothetical protein